MGGQSGRESVMAKVIKLTPLTDHGGTLLNVCASFTPPTHSSPALSPPMQILGPLLSTAHHAIWQKTLGQLIEGQPQVIHNPARHCSAPSVLLCREHLRVLKESGIGVPAQGNRLWNIVDVRDLALSQRLMAESDAVSTPHDRFQLSAPGPAGAQPGVISTRALVSRVKQLYPDFAPQPVKEENALKNSCNGDCSKVRRPTPCRPPPPTACCILPCRGLSCPCMPAARRILCAVGWQAPFDGAAPSSSFEEEGNLPIDVSLAPHVGGRGVKAAGDPTG